MMTSFYDNYYWFLNLRGIGQFRPVKSKNEINSGSGSQVVNAEMVLDAYPPAFFACLFICFSPLNHIPRFSFVSCNSSLNH